MPRTPAAPNAFTVLWSQADCKHLETIGDTGSLEVAFGGPHTSMPTLSKLRVGDRLYALAVRNGDLYVMAWLDELVDPDAFVRARVGLEPHCQCGTLEERALWSAAGHLVPSTCVLNAVTGRGSTIRHDRRVPPDVVAALRFGPKPGHEQPLRGVVDRRLTSVLPLQGHARRLRAASAQRLADVVAAMPA